MCGSIDLNMGLIRDTKPQLTHMYAFPAKIIIINLEACLKAKSRWYVLSS